MFPMRTTVFAAVVVLGFGLPSIVSAETPEQRYFDARDAAIAKVTAAMDAYIAMPAEAPREIPAAPAKGKATAQDKAKTAALERSKAAAFDKAKAAALEKVTALDKAERGKLEAEMREIVGPMPIAGFDKDGKLNLDHLIKNDQGFGTLDGLTFTSTDKKASIIVTTTGVFRRWLADHKDWWKNASLPQQPGRAVQQNAFYTQALVTDSAIVGFTELHVRKPLGSVFVYVMLGSRSQDGVPREANELLVAVGRGGHVFIAQSRSIAAVGPIARCDLMWKDATGPQPDEKTRKIVETRYLKCFSGWARYQPNYSEAVRAAQQIIDAIAAR